MKQIKIKFLGLGPNFDYKKFFLYQILEKHFDVVISETPDYLIYSCHTLFDPGCESHLKYSDCVKIYYTNENLAPDFNLCDYGISFEYLQYGDRHFRYPKCYTMASHPGLTRPWAEVSSHKARQRFCSFVYSNAGADPLREQLYTAINAYKPVDGGGKLHHTLDIPHVEGHTWEQDRIDFEKQFKFSIACENSSHPGYSTEKIMISFAAGAIPIYWGDPLIKKIYNEKAFICAFDYPNLESLVNRIREIDNSPPLYEEIISQPVFAPGIDFSKINEDLESFLIHIFEQPKEAAFRRNRVFWGDLYLKHFLQSEKYYNRMLELDSRLCSSFEYKVRNRLGPLKRVLFPK